MIEKSKQIGRLALREEGTFWNAYYAMPYSMEGAILLGSISMRFVVGHPERRQAFMALMREGVSDILQDATGVRPTWPDEPHAAPEHERAGHS